MHLILDINPIYVLILNKLNRSLQEKFHIQMINSNLIVPVKSTGSWGMMASLARSVARSTLLISRESIKIVPSIISSIRKRARMVEDFPLPVLPQMPIWKKTTYSLNNKSFRRKPNSWKNFIFFKCRKKVRPIWERVRVRQL